MTKKILKLIAFLLIIIPNLNAQKVKYKKGEVLVDKEHKFDFVEIKEEGRDTKLKQYSLRDLEGKEILILTDTVFYYNQLPNETSKRKAYEAYICSAPHLGLKSLMPYNKVSKYPKQRIKDLKKVGFFKDFDLNEDRFNEFVKKQHPSKVVSRLEEIENTNISRKKNYELTEEKFGALFNRKPSRINVFINIKKKGSYIIQEGSDLVVGKINLKKKGENNHTYEIVNNDDVVIADVNVFQKTVSKNGLSKYQYNVKPYVFGSENSEDNYKWFYNKVKKMGSPKSIGFKLEKIADYLIHQGLL